MNTNGARKWWALAAVSLAVMAVALDGTVLSVALPTLAGALRASESDLQWFSSGYLLVLAATVLPAGVVGDRFGRKKTLLASLALFGVGSVACALADSSTQFLVARLVLGLAGAGVMVSATAAIPVLFGPEQRATAVGFFSAANFLALPLGPLLGGWMLNHFSWGSLFLVNVPVVVLGLGVAWALIPESRAAARPRLDGPGIVGSTVALVGIMAGLIRAGEHGWGDVGAWLMFAAGVLAMVLFLRWESRLARTPGREPMLDTRLFASRSFTWGAVLASVAGLGLIGLSFTLPQFFQGVLGDSAFRSGLQLLPVIAGLVVGALPASWIAAQIGSRTVIVLGFTLAAVGFAVGSATAAGSSLVFVAAWNVVVGLGTGLVVSTATSLALGTLSVESTGIGSAVVQAVNKMGAPLGTAILGSVVAAGYRDSLDLTGLPADAARAVRASVFAGVEAAQAAGSSDLLAGVRAAFMDGMSGALLVSAGIAALGATVALLLLPRVSRARPVAAAEVQQEEGATDARA